MEKGKFTSPVRPLTVTAAFGKSEFTVMLVIFVVSGLADGADGRIRGVVLLGFIPGVFFGIGLGLVDSAPPP
jgi:hypothetical protein